MDIKLGRYIPVSLGMPIANELGAKDVIVLHGLYDLHEIKDFILKSNCHRLNCTIVVSINRVIFRKIGVEWMLESERLLLKTFN